MKIVLKLMYCVTLYVLTNISNVVSADARFYELNQDCSQFTTQEKNEFLTTYTQEQVNLLSNQVLAYQKGLVATIYLNTKYYKKPFITMEVLSERLSVSAEFLAKEVLPDLMKKNIIQKYFNNTQKNDYYFLAKNYQIKPFVKKVISEISLKCRH
jgi:hypothetical protein